MLHPIAPRQIKLLRYYTYFPDLSGSFVLYIATAYIVKSSRFFPLRDVARRGPPSK